MASDPSIKGQPKTVRLGKYTVVDAIATGGMGTIFRAHDPETGRDFALKMLTPEMAAKPAMRERFRREAGHAASLHHENIVKSYELFEYHGKVFIPMEFVDGIDLAHYIEAHTRLDPEETREIMIQACRALKHAHDRGIVHRDIKPSNFLLCNKSGRLVVKLTDFGLARDPDREAQLTTEGTTIGTVNYISPEQARDSGSADIRSDLYSLGCTWYHMLTGQPPFPEGGIAERIVKHLEEEPPDVRQFNPRVSKALVTMLNKLLAKKPRDRYQTPAELLNDLHSLTAVKLPKEAARAHSVADERDEEGPATTRRAPTKRKSKGKRRGDDTLANKSDTIVMRLPRRLLWIGTAVIVAALLLAAVILVIAWKWPHGTSPDNTSPPPNRVGWNGPVTPANNDPRIKPDPVVKPDPDGKPAPLPSLLPPKAPPIEVAALRERLDAAFPKEEFTNKDPLRIQRTTVGAATTFTTLADALAKSAPELPVTIEIQDNGPLFWSTTVLRGRDVTLCAAKGYRPLIVWDMEKTMQERGKMPGRPLTFLTIEGGRLLMEGIDVVLQWPDKLQDPLTLVQATNADFSARHCTFSLSGQHSHPVVVTRLIATKAKPRRCLFTDCVLRGNSLQALDLNAPGGLVLFENCLVAGGDFPLFQVRGSREEPATVYAVRSTLMAASSLLRLQGAQPADNSPSLNWLGWDSILSRSNEKAGGEMIVLPPGATPTKINWESFNTLYAGWQMLLTGAEPIPLDASSTWRRVMRCPSGDRAIADLWPPPQLDLSEVAATTFRTTKTPLAFAASVNSLESVGCVLEQLPPLRDNWKALAYERFVVPSFNILEDAAAPDIPRPSGNLFTGQVLDVSTEDLGVFLQKMQATRGFGPKVVMLLKGTGAQPMSPVKLKGVHLTLHFEQPPDDSKHLSLTLSSTADVPLPAALLEIEDGGLDIINGGFTLPDGPNKAVPASLFKVSGGDLRLYRCRLAGPHLATPPANYRGLIQLEGSGSIDGQKGRQCVINESVLVSENAVLLLHGIGTRLLVKQSVLIAGGAALQVEVGTGFKGRANVKAVLSSSSIASRQCVLQVEDAALEPTMEPIVLQSMQCAFQAPFRNANPGVIRYSGDALAHGLFVWQSDADLFDKRFQFGCLPVSLEPPKPPAEWQAAWLNLFGTYAATRMRTEMLTRQIDATKGWSVRQLQLPGLWSPDNNPPVYGADLIGRGFVKKPKRP